MNIEAVTAIYSFEMSRWGRTLMQSIVSPVLSTCLYFIVFGSAIGSRISQVDGVDYGSFIVPGLVMMLLLTQSTLNASFGIYFPRFTGTIYEHLSAPVSPFEIVLGYVGRCRDEVGHPRAARAGHCQFFRDASHRTSDLDDVVPAAYGNHLQHARFHHRDLGRRVREAPDHTASHHHTTHIPWRHVLFGQDAAAFLANRDAFQPCRLFDQRISLELL